MNNILSKWASDNLSKNDIVKLNLNGIVDVEWIDNALEDGISQDIMKKFSLMYHDDKTYPLLIINGSLRAAIDHYCYRCSKVPITLFHGAGLHRGAWCYAFDFEGNVIANLRDQCYVCDNCFDKDSKTTRSD